MNSTVQIFNLPIHRKDIERPSRQGSQSLAEALTKLARLWIIDKKAHRVELTIDGYGNDPRELYEIPQVCQWANTTSTEFPIIAFFLNDSSIDRFAGWLCGPTSSKQASSPEFTITFERTRKSCLIEAVVHAEDFFQHLDADKQTIFHLFNDILSQWSKSGTGDFDAINLLTTVVEHPSTNQPTTKHNTDKSNTKKWWHFWK